MKNSIIKKQKYKEPNKLENLKIKAFVILFLFIISLFLTTFS